MSRKQANLTRRLALFDDDETAAPVIAEINALGKQKQQLEAECAAVRSRRTSWQVAQHGLSELVARCRTLRPKGREWTYAEKRELLVLLGLKVKLFKRGHTPRYAITLSLPIDLDDLSGDNSTAAGPPRGPVGAEHIVSPAVRRCSGNGTGL